MSRVRSESASPIALLCLVAAVSGCASSSRYVNGVFESEKTSYSFPSPGEEWEMVDAEADMAFRHPRTGAIVYVNSTCDYRKDIPLASLSDHLLLDLTERTIERRELVSLDGREALLTAATGKLDGVLVVLHLLVMKKNWCIYDIVHAGFPGKTEQTLGRFQEILAQFRTLR